MIFERKGILGEKCQHLVRLLNRIWLNCAWPPPRGVFRGWSRSTVRPYHVSAGTGTPWSEAPQGKNGNPFVNTRFMSMSSFRFWLHLDQPQRLCIPRSGVLHLVKRRQLGIAGYSTRVAAARSQVSQQRSKPLNRQTIPCRVRLLLEAHRL